MLKVALTTVALTLFLAAPAAASSDLRASTSVDAYCVQASSCKKLGIYAYSTTGQVVSRVCVRGRCQRGRAGWFTSSFRLGQAVQVGDRVKVKIKLRAVKTGQTSFETIRVTVRRVNQ
jgi:hypothetical protein